MGYKGFSNFRTQIRTRLQPWLKVSCASTNLDPCLLLADRVLCACAGEATFQQTKMDLDKLFSGEFDGSIEEQNILLDNIEHWYKAILWICDETAYKRNQEQDIENSNKRFNLYQCMLDLGMLKKKELALPREKYLEIISITGQHLLRAKEGQSDWKHDKSRLTAEVRETLWRDLVVAYLAPVLLHEKKLREILAGLVTSDLSLESDEENILSAMNESRKRHLSWFGGRVEYLRKLKNLVRDRFRSSGQNYLLIAAPEGTGKSAIVSKFIEESIAKKRVFGYYATQVRRYQEALPFISVHFGKQSSDPVVIARLLLKQINIGLIRPVPSPESGYYSGKIVADEPTILIPNHEVDVRVTGKSHPHGGWGQRDESKRWQAALFAALRQSVEERGAAVIVVDAVDEIGVGKNDLGFLPEVLPSGCVVILSVRQNEAAHNWALDALKPIPHVLHDLTEEELPVILGIEPVGQGKDFLKKIYEQTRGWAHAISRIKQEVAANGGDYSKVSAYDYNATLERQAQDWGKTSAPELSREIFQLLAIFEPCGTISLSDVQEYIRRSSEKHNTITLPEIKSVLTATAAQIDGVHTGQLRLSVRCLGDFAREKFYSQIDLDEMLSRYAKWLGESKSVAPVLISGFLDFYLVKHKGQKETLSMLVSDLCEKATPERLIAIAKGLKDTSEEISAIWLRFMEKAIAAGSSDAKRILGLAYLRGRRVMRDSEKGLALLDSCAKAWDIKAILQLGQTYSAGIGTEVDYSKAKFYLTMGAEKGDPEAIRDLAELFVSEDNPSQDIKSGIRWFEEGVKQNQIIVKLAFANFLSQVSHIYFDLQRAKQLFIEIVGENAKESAQACYRLSRALASSLFERDRLDGESYLQRAETMGSQQARLTALKQKVLNVFIDDSQRESAFDAIEEMADNAYAPACELLASWYQEGVWRGQDEQKARYYQRKSLELHESTELKGKPIDFISDSTLPIDVRFYFTTELIDGKPKEEELQLAEKNMREFTNTGLTAAGLALASYLLDGDVLPKNPAEAKRILESVAQRGNIKAKLKLLEVRLSEGTEDEIAIAREEMKSMVKVQGYAMLWAAQKMLNNAHLQAEGVAALSNATEQKMYFAPIFLSMHYADRGEKEKGEYWRSLGAQYGDVSCLLDISIEKYKNGEIELGAVLDTIEQASLYWINNPPVQHLGTLVRVAIEKNENPEKCGRLLSLLEKYSQLGDIKAMRLLGNVYIEGLCCHKNPITGQEFFEKAIALGSSLARVDLAERYLIGNGIPQDVNKAVKILEAAKDSPKCIALLGEALIEHRKDIDRGVALLIESAELGDKKGVEKLAHVSCATNFYDSNVEEVISGRISLIIKVLSQAAKKDNLDAIAGLAHLMLAGRVPDINGEAQILWDRAKNKMKPADLPLMGAMAYSRNDYSEAVSLYLKAYMNEGGERQTHYATNLIYLIRRFPRALPENTPSIREIEDFSDKDSKQDGFFQINIALCFAKGSQRSVNWREVAKHVSNIHGKDIERIFAWWHRLSKKGDSEGHFVVGMLVKYNRVKDPDDMSVKERFGLARIGGWAVPADWDE